MTTQFVEMKFYLLYLKSKSYRCVIDEEILLVLGQLDQSSKILDYLYLGSEWNAQNLEELTENKITHILNVTREIDNFFPGTFKYKNIRVWDLGNYKYNEANGLYITLGFYTSA